MLVPRRVVTIALPPLMRLGVRDALPKHVLVSEVASALECAQILRQEVGVTVVFAVPADLSEPAGAPFLQLQREFPNTPFIALFDDETSEPRWGLELGRWEISDMVTCTPTVPAPLLLSSITRCEAETVAIRVWKRAGITVADELLPVLKPALRIAHSPIALAALAKAAMMPERSLRDYCAQRQLPSPQWIIGWSRLLVAAYYLEEPGRTIQSVVELLQFPSHDVFAHTVRRYTGMTASRLREKDPVRTIGRLLAMALTPRPGASSRARDKSRSPLAHPEAGPVRVVRTSSGASILHLVRKDASAR